MDGQEAVHLYTVDEARDLVPTLRPMLVQMRLEQRRLYDEIEQFNQLTEVMQQNGHADEADHLEQRILALGESIRETLAEFDDLGIAVKDIANGVIDFPSEREGRVVYHCWQIDEETITHWHELDSGFIGRQPLDE